MDDVEEWKARGLIKADLDSWEHMLPSSSNIYGNGMFQPVGTSLFVPVGTDVQHDVFHCTRCENWQIDYPWGCGVEVQEYITDAFNEHIASIHCRRVPSRSRLETLEGVRRPMVLAR